MFTATVQSKTLPPTQFSKVHFYRRDFWSSSPEGKTTPYLTWHSTQTCVCQSGPWHICPFSKSANTYVYTAPQRIMDLSCYSPLSACNKAFRACSPHLFGT